MHDLLQVLVLEMKDDPAGVIRKMKDEDRAYLRVDDAEAPFSKRMRNSTRTMV